MTKNSSTGEGPRAVAPVAFLISRGTRVADPRVLGPNGSRLAIGDRWIEPITKGGMAATVEIHPDGVKVFVTHRVDRWSAREWSAFAGLPTIVTMLAMSPIAWMLLDCHGHHARAPMPLDLEPAEGRMLQTLLARRESLDNSMTLFGIADDVVCSIKVGLALDGVWRMLAEAAAATPSRLPEQQLLDALRHQAALDPSEMFAEAMRRQLEPRPR